MARRKLTPEELALWRKVQETVTPLAAPIRKAATPVPSRPGPKKPDSAGPGLAASGSSGPGQFRTASQPQPKRAPSAGSPLEPRLRRRLARGSRQVDARIDLHGMRQAEARAALERFLRDARGRDARLVLVITGKGRSGEAGGGVLRGALPRWLALPEFHGLVVGFEEASRRHGGAGAFYVRLRRSRGAA